MTEEPEREAVEVGDRVEQIDGEPVCPRPTAERTPTSVHTATIAADKAK